MLKALARTLLIAAAIAYQPCEAANLYLRNYYSYGDDKVVVETYQESDTHILYVDILINGDRYYRVHSIAENLLMFVLSKIRMKLPGIVEDYKENGMAPDFGNMCVQLHSNHIEVIGDDS